MTGKAIEIFMKGLSPFNPTRSYLLDLFHLDKQFVRGCGHYLYDRNQTQYLDFLSQFGAVSLGHNHPDLCQVVRTCLDEGIPAMAQPLVPLAAEELAKRLAEITPGELAHTIFTNSGAEAVEAAIKLARAKTGRRWILSTFNGFHGNTLGALSATGKEQYQKPFGAPVPHFDYIPFGDLDALEYQLKRRADPIAAFLVEPIQGEGGVVTPPIGYLAAALALCRQHRVLFILDEIQTGLGRTGEMFAWPADAGAPDILLLAKALGGGLFPIGACISTEKTWDHEFGLLHTSTFAGNNLACRVGLKVIEILTRDQGRVVREVARNGLVLFERLRELQRRYPTVIKEVRGRGFLAGIEFWPFDGDDSYTMAYFSRGDYLIACLSGYLFNVHRILTAPVFNHSHVLRLEPPFTVGPQEIDSVVQALEVICSAIERKDYYHLVRYLTGSYGLPPTRRRYLAPNPPNPSPPPQTSARPRGRFAFLMHFTQERDILQTDPSYEQFQPHEFARWREFVQDSEPGVVYHLKHLESATGALAEGWLIAIGMLPVGMLNLGRRKMLPILKEAVRLAKENGANVIGLGGFTSIMSRGGQGLVGEGVAITSGSALTAVMAVDGVAHVAELLGRDLAQLRVAVVGAGGAIGRLCALLLAGRSAGLILVGHAAVADGEARCRSVAAEIEARRPTLQSACRTGVLCTTDLDAALPLADVVIMATNSSKELIGPGHLKADAIVCDIARPPNVSAQVLDQRDDVVVFEGGLVELPQEVHFGPNLLGFRPGINLACLAECMLLALEGDFRDHSIGQEIDSAEAESLRALALKHGFRVASPHWAAKELPASYFQRLRARRGQPTAVR